MSLSMLAAAGGQDDILRLLIKKGVKVNGRQKNGTTALMHAAEKVIIASLLKLFCSFSLYHRRLLMSLIVLVMCSHVVRRSTITSLSLPPEFPHHCGHSTRGRILFKCSDTGWGDSSYEGKYWKEEGRLIPSFGE